MVNTGDLESFLSEKNAKSGDIVTIKGEGEIVEQDTQFGKRMILNIPVELKSRNLIWSPGKLARSEGEKLFKSKDTKDWVGKQFSVLLVKMTIKGEMKDIIVPSEVKL